MLWLPFGENLQDQSHPYTPLSSSGYWHTRCSVASQAMRQLFGDLGHLIAAGGGGITG